MSFNKIILSKLQTKQASALNSLLFLALMCNALWVGCFNQSTPPGPSSSFGIIQPGTHFEFSLWEEGLAVLVIDNIPTAHSSGGIGSTIDPVYRQTGKAQTKTGAGYDWEIATTDGRTADIKINGADYDIAQGAVFVVEVNGEECKIQQLDLDLSGISDVEDCKKFIEANTDKLQVAEGQSEAP